MEMGFLIGMRVFPCREALSLLWTWAFEQLGGHFVPSIGTPVFEVWKDFLTRGVLSHKGVCFPMCRVRFFLPPWTHVGPLKEFLRGFVSQNHVPSCLLPSPPSPLPHGDPGSGVFTYCDPWPPDNPG